MYILIVFDDIIADMIHNKKLDSIDTKLFISGRKLNIYLVSLPNDTLKFQTMFDWILLNFFIAKIPNRREFQEIAQNHSS